MILLLECERVDVEYVGTFVDLNHGIVHVCRYSDHDCVDFASSQPVLELLDVLLVAFPVLDGLVVPFAAVDGVVLAFDHEIVRTRLLCGTIGAQRSVWGRACVPLLSPSGSRAASVRGS